MRFLYFIFVLAVIGAPARAADPATEVLDAAEALDAAAAALSLADTSEDRLVKIAGAVRAYERALSRVREAGRRATLGLRESEVAFAEEAAELSQLTAALIDAGAPDRPTRILHPKGAMGSARAAMLMAEVTPFLEAEANRLGNHANSLRSLAAAASRAEAELSEGLIELRAARQAMLTAVEADAPKDAAETQYQQDLMNVAASGLQELALALLESPEADALSGPSQFEIQKGRLPLPVIGAVLLNFGDADASGVARPGVAIAAAPRAVVTTPVLATLRFRGSVNGYGNVIILELAPEKLLVLTGLDETFGAPGQTLQPGAPVGLMGAADNTEPSNQGERGEMLTKTLYVETRESGQTVNPALWFALDKDPN